MSDDVKLDQQRAAMDMIRKINEVEGFDPTSLAVEYNDMNGNEKRLKLPVAIQIAWFRLKYPEGRIATSVTAGKDCFIATSRVYHHYTDEQHQYLAEATASRGYLVDKPEISPREWAQTASVGIALRNAGFGLQFAAGDLSEGPAVDELGGIIWGSETPDQNASEIEGSSGAEEPALGSVTKPVRPTTARRGSAKKKAESPLEAAMKTPCPIAKYKGKTLGDVANMDPKAIVWVATKYTGDEAVSAAAKLLCDQSLASPV